MRVLSVWPTLAAERSITSSVGKQLRATTIGGLLLLSGSKSHAIQFIASRKQSCARPACPGDCAVLCYARYDVTRGMILRTRHMCCWCMRQRRNCAVVVVAVERLLFHCLCRRARAFCGDAGLEYLILNSTPRIPSPRLLVFTYVSETTKARSKSAVMAQVCGQCHVRCINKS